jgi:hypothetical protein
MRGDKAVAFAIHQRNQRNRHAKDIRGQGRQVIEPGIRFGIESFRLMKDGMEAGVIPLWR